MLIVLAFALLPLPFTLLAAWTKYRTSRINPASRYLMWAMLCFSVALVVNAAAFVLNTLQLGAPYGADLISHVVLLAGSSLLLETTVTVGKDEAPAAAGRRRRIAIAVVAVVGLVVTYAMADLQPTGQLLTEVGATDPWMLAHWTIMIVSVMWSLTAIGLQDAWLWRHSPPGPTRVGFGMMVVGTALGNLYFIHKAYYLAARNLGVDHGLFIDRFSEVGVAIFVVSLLLCTLGSFWNDVREMRGAKQSLDMSSRWRLRHLWRPLQAIADRNVVPPAGGGLLYQRIIQIMDVLAEVRAYVDQPTYAAVRTACVRAAGSAAEADVLTLAACIEVARQVKAGHRATDGTTSDINLPAGDELYDQLHALLRVARVMRRGARIVEDLNRPGQGPALTSLPQVSS